MGKHADYIVAFSEVSGPPAVPSVGPAAYTAAVCATSTLLHSPFHTKHRTRKASSTLPPSTSA